MMNSFKGVLGCLFLISSFQAGAAKSTGRWVANMSSPELAKWRHEVSGATSMGLKITDDGDTQFTFMTKYGYLIFPGVQVGPTLDVDYIGLDSGGDITKVIFLLGPTINFNIDSNSAFTLEGDLNKQFFAGFGLGLAHGSFGSTGDTKFAFGFDIGKRFKLTETITYKPYFQLLYAVDYPVIFNLAFLSLSLHL